MCEYQFTDEFIDFTNLLNKKKASWKCENNNYVLVYYEMDGLTGEELEIYCKKKGIPHPVFANEENRKKYLHEQIISIPSKVCHCCP